MVSGTRQGLPRSARRALIVVAVAAAFWLALFLVPIGLILLGDRTEVRLKHALSELKAAGEPVEMTQLARPPVPDEQNAALVFNKAFQATHLSSDDSEFIDRISSEKSSLADPAVAQRARDLVGRNSEALRLIHQAGAMPKCRFDIDWSKGFNVDFPQFDNLRSCRRLLTYESVILAHSGRADEALGTYKANLHLANAADEPVISAQLARYTILAIGSRA